MDYAHHDMSAHGWWSGDGHQHILPDGKAWPALATAITATCRARNLHWLCLCQPWGQPSAALAHHGPLAFTPWHADCVHIWLGGELPKTRYGHTWWLNLPALELPFDRFTDRAIEAWYAGRVHGPAPPPYADHSTWAYITQLVQAGALPVFAHPTSWWTTAPPPGRFVSNIAALLSLYALARAGPLAMVVMGYDADQIFYQHCWFHLLNAGYRATAMAETDGALDAARPRFCLGALRTYVWLDPATALTPRTVRDAVADGRTIVSSGPFIDARITTVAGYNGPGCVVPAEGTRHVMRIVAHAAPIARQHISQILVYRNGAVVAHHTASAAHPMVALDVPLCESADCWYVVKVYGLPGPRSHFAADVLAYARHCIATGTTEYAGDNQVAITSPFYFRTTPAQPDPEPVPMSWFDPDLRLDALLRACYSGAWRAQWPHAQPGQVPWDAFPFERLRDAITAA